MSRYDISENGLRFIAGEEGQVKRGGLHVLYNDPAGHATIGWGHLVHYGPIDGSEPEEFKRGLTDEQALALKKQDAQRFVKALNRLVTVPLTQNQVDATLSLMFNIGEGGGGEKNPGFEESSVRRLLNRGDYQGAADAFLMWKYAGGRPILLERRKRERALFLSDSPTQETPVAGLDNLHPVFAQRVANACRARGTSVYSGARSTVRQGQLYQDYLAGRGNPANPPGTSWHEYGEGMKGGRWALAVDFAEPYPHGEPGLVFPIKGEPWHAQPPEIPEPSRVAGAENRLPAVTAPSPKEDELFSPSPIAAVHLISAHSGLLLTSSGDKHMSGVTQERANGSLNQRWQLVGHEDGTVSFVCRAGDLALDRPDYKTEKGTLLQVARCEHNDAQRWQPEELADGRWRIWAPGTNRCLDIRGASKDAGAGLQLWVANEGRWQSFGLAFTV